MSPPTEDTGQDFLKSYTPRRTLGPEVYGSQAKGAPPNLDPKQSDVTIASQSSKVYDYGLESMSKHSDQPDVTKTAIEDETILTAGSGQHFLFTTPSPYKDSDWLSLPGTDPDSGSESDTLETLLHDATLKQKGGGGMEWLPRDALYSICTWSRVRKELQQRFSTDKAEEYADYVCGTMQNPKNDKESGRRIFSILVLISKVNEISRFVRHQISDGHLPFLWVDSESRKEVHSPTWKPGREPLPCFDAKTRPLMKNFVQAQWQLLVPFFSHNDQDEVNEYILHSQTIMPWVEYVEPEKTSGFSRVFRVKLHSAHHAFKHKSFALKTLLQGNRLLGAQEFRSELHVFRKMKPELHLLELCATFEMTDDDSGKYSFLFPWADGGSLEKLWTKEPRHMVSGKVVTASVFLHWIAEQCSGLAGALASIHDVRVQALKRLKLEDYMREDDNEHYGIHGDIKPENILHFSHLEDCKTGLGVLKIADFGLTDFHTFRSRTTDAFVRGRVLPPAPTYVAPELIQPGEYVSRKADIWSFGCVFSQFITWAIRGVGSVKKFNEKRLDETDFDHTKQAPKSIKMDRFFRAEFYLPNQVEVSLKESTRKWMCDLQAQVKQDQCENFLTQFNSLILEEMLEPQRKKRIDCETLVKKLVKFVEIGRSSQPNDPYWNPPLPTFEQPSQVLSAARPRQNRKVSFALEQ